MSRFDKKTIASALALATLLGNKTSAVSINEAQNPQTLGAVGGEALSNFEKPRKTQSMGIGARFAVGMATLVGGYGITNEVLGDNGWVNHPAMGRFTVKKTIEYWMRDVEKEKALIDRIIEFIDNSGSKIISDLIAAKMKEFGNNSVLDKAINEILIKNKDLISNIKIDSCSVDIKGQEDQYKFNFLCSLMKSKDLLINTKNDLSKGFTIYSVGILKFDLSKNSICVNIPDPSSLKTKKVEKLLGEDIIDIDWWASNVTMLGNVVFTLNRNGSLTLKCFMKKLDILGLQFIRMPGVPAANGLTFQFTIPAPAPKK